MNIRLINEKSHAASKKALQNFYEKKFLVPDKKEYLTQHFFGVGPFMGMKGEGEEPSYLFDAASQIATLGLGFNPSAFFGPSQLQESWLNSTQTENFTNLKLAFQNFLLRKLNWPHINTRFCHSGAEANEIAMGFCYQRRTRPAAKKVLAFEGSFHGRMLISLSSTWNKSKREPFEWPGYDTVYTAYPELKDGKIQREIPAGWQKAWQDSVNKDFSVSDVPKVNDPEIENEIQCLMGVREKLRSGEIFTVIIEPMQCEGGDRYSSNRFHNALINMCRSFSVPLIYDEVQTGFHLGRSFFWHREFDLRDDKGNFLRPDYVVCAKKAQIGLVCCSENNPHEPTREGEAQEFSVASLARGYVHGACLDQRQSQIHEIESMVKTRLEKYVSQYSDALEFPRLAGLAFSFDFKDKEKVAEFIKIRFDHGLLYYPAGDRTLRFRINTACGEKELNFLFHQLERIADLVFKGSTDKELLSDFAIDTTNVERSYQLHQLFMQTKLQMKKGSEVSEADLLKKVSAIFHLTDDNVRLIDLGDQFPQYQSQIEKIEEDAYEPARQTEIEKFQMAAERGLALGLLQNDSLVGIAFASALEDLPFERGVRQDPHFGMKDSLYMLDVTVTENFSGKGAGKLLKSALTLLATARGFKRIEGRNRDRMAGKMWEINLSLGAMELLYLPEDYPDMQENRDSIFYTLPLTWEENALQLNKAHHRFDEAILDNEESLYNVLPSLVNKVCLSNFVNEDYLENFHTILKEFSPSLQQGYTTSGQSECVDKIIKSLWMNKKPAQKMVTFEGCYFGSGSFLSRSLSNIGDTFFPVTTLPFPGKENWKDVLKQVEDECRVGSLLGVFIEPLTQKGLQAAPKEFLKGLRKLTAENQTPLIYNETASRDYHYCKDHLYISQNEEFAPDAVLAYLGGQFGIVGVRKEHFLDKPLMMISTWDGDEVSAALYVAQLENLKTHKGKYQEIREEFCNKLTEELGKVEDLSFEVSNGGVRTVGVLPGHLKALAESVSSRVHLFFPTISDMKKYLGHN